MLAILDQLGTFIVNLFKSQRRLEVENLFRRHQLNIALRDAPHRLRLRGSDRAGAASSGSTLILDDQLDTYPAGDPSRWDKTGGDPFRPTRDGDFLYARGTSDTRGNLACTILAVEAIRRAGICLNGTLKCVYTVDEEKNGRALVPSPKRSASP
jgi:acetylornithine deacetylase/succinyl-diaminopimelate desuccinylase-like protein